MILRITYKWHQQLPRTSVDLWQVLLQREATGAPGPGRCISKRSSCWHPQGKESWNGLCRCADMHTEACSFPQLSGTVSDPFKLSAPVLQEEWIHINLRWSHLPFQFCFPPSPPILSSPPLSFQFFLLPLFSSPVLPAGHTQEWHHIKKIHLLWTTRLLV